MAIRGPHAQRSTSKRPWLAIFLAALAGLLYFLVADGQIYRLTNGSSIGLVMTIAAIWGYGLSAFIAFWVAVDPLRRGRRKQGASIHGIEAKRAAGERTDSKKAA